MYLVFSMILVLSLVYRANFFFFSLFLVLFFQHILSSVWPWCSLWYVGRIFFIVLSVFLVVLFFFQCISSSVWPWCSLCYVGRIFYIYFLSISCYFLLVFYMTLVLSLVYRANFYVFSLFLLVLFFSQCILSSVWSWCCVWYVGQMFLNVFFIVLVLLVVCFFFQRIFSSVWPWCCVWYVGWNFL